MNKKIAVVITDRQEEALRMSIGLTLADDEVDVYFMDKKLSHVGDNDMNIETGKELGVGLYSTCEETDDLTLISPEELAGKLLNYDHILPY